MILIKLLLAHLIGDFLLQFNSWVVAKESKKILAWQLYAHTLVHFIFIVLLIWEKEFIVWALALSFAHLCIDIIKLYAQSEQTRRVWFFADQLAHIASIVLVCVLYGEMCIQLPTFNTAYTLLLITFAYALTQPASTTIRAIISKWTPTPVNAKSLSNAGNIIGILERLLVFTFVITAHWEAIGFLLAAKSVFRFGDLKQSDDRKLTEYVLIGTLLSFGVALLGGIVFLWLSSAVV